MSTSWFNKNSERAKAGLGFQDLALQEFRSAGISVQSVPDWLKSMDPCLENKQVWALEKTWGDLICTRPDGTYLFIECVTASQEETVFPMSKLQFEGKNKWYLFGWDDQRHFVPSGAWNSYVKKIERVTARESDIVANVRRSQYSSMRCGISGLDSFLTSEFRQTSAPAPRHISAPSVEHLV